jgi:hypothetical protein
MHCLCGPFKGGCVLKLIHENQTRTYKACNGVETFHLELHRQCGRIKAIWGKSGIDKDFLAVDQLLCNHTGKAQHSKTSILEFLGVEFQKFCRILGGKSQRIKSGITREVIFLQDTATSKDIARVGPPLEGTVELKSTNDNGKKLKEGGADGPDFIQVSDGRSNVLISCLEEWVEFNWFLSDKHTKGSQHGNTSVLKFGLTVLLDSFVVACGISKRIKVGDRVKGSREAIAV